MNRRLIWVCDIKPGDYVSGVQDTAPTHTVETWDGANLTLVDVETADTQTLHLVDPLDKIAQYS